MLAKKVNEHRDVIKQKLNDGAIAKQDVTTIVSNLGNLMLAKANYSAIAQMTDAINLRVQKGDVITSVNGRPVSAAAELAAQLRPGARLTLEIERGAQKLPVALILEQ